jgi:cyanophycin synthetase
VVKPLDANHGRGVSIGLETEERSRAAFEKAREHARTVLVETFLRASTTACLVVNGELVAVAKRVPGHVVGDGEHTIAELVELVNPTRAAASATRRCSPGSSSTTRPSA